MLSAFDPDPQGEAASISRDVKLMARATDTSGTAQPFAYDLDLNGFEVTQVQAVRVEVS